MLVGGCLKNVFERRNSSLRSKFPNLLDAPELLNIARAKWDRRRFEPAIDEAMCGQEFGDALGVPRRRIQRPHRTGKRVHALVQEEVPSVVRARLVYKPKAIAVTVAIFERWKFLRQ